MSVTGRVKRGVRNTLIGAGLLLLGYLGLGSLGDIVPKAPQLPSITLPALPTSAVEPTELTVQITDLPSGPITTDTPYDRDLFGQSWADIDHTGCDQRNEALALAMTEISYRADTRECVVESGTFHDAYDGTSWPFVKSQDGGGVEIDHIVPLAHAWEMGAAAWSPEQREVFANDLINVQATAGTYNGSKGSRGPLEWMPADTTYHCTYLERWAQIKVDWDLAVTEDERTHLVTHLAACEED